MTGKACTAQYPRQRCMLWVAGTTDTANKARMVAVKLHCHTIKGAQHREHGGCTGPCVTDSISVACKACRAHLAISKLFVQLSNLFEGCSLVLLQLPNLFLLGGQSILQGCLLLLVLLLVANC